MELESCWNKIFQDSSLSSGFENKWDSRLVVFTDSNGFTSQKKNKPFAHWCVPLSHFQVGRAHSNLCWLTAVISGMRGAHICTLRMERLICREQCSRITSKKNCVYFPGVQSNMVIIVWDSAIFFLTQNHWSFFSKVYCYHCTIQMYFISFYL